MFWGPCTLGGRHISKVHSARGLFPATPRSGGGALTQLAQDGLGGQHLELGGRHGTQHALHLRPQLLGRHLQHKNKHRSKWGKYGIGQDGSRRWRRGAAARPTPARGGRTARVVCCGGQACGRGSEGRGRGSGRPNFVASSRASGRAANWGRAHRAAGVCRRLCRLAVLLHGSRPLLALLLLLLRGRRWPGMEGVTIAHAKAWLQRPFKQNTHASTGPPGGPPRPCGRAGRCRASSWPAPPPCACGSRAPPRSLSPRPPRCRSPPPRAAGWGAVVWAGRQAGKAGGRVGGHRWNWGLFEGGPTAHSGS